MPRGAQPFVLNRGGDTAEATTADLVVVGAGAAGLSAAIFTARRAPGLRVVCLEGARHPGAKILVSGGTRCNVTNREVSAHDYWGGPSRVVRNVLRAWPPPRVVEFFAALGVTLHEEEDGKLFPDSMRARSVLDALLGEAAARGVVLETSCRVEAVDRDDDRFVVTAGGRRWRTRAVLLATGGRSLPKSGSDGFGYQLARRLGHGFVETTPALAPLVLGEGPHATLAGVTHRVALHVRGGGIDVRVSGAMLWTHVGISGPAALNASRHWHRVALSGAAPELSIDVCPGETFESLEAWLLARGRERPRAQVATVLAERLPAAVAAVWLDAVPMEQGRTLAHVTREERRRLVHLLHETRLDVRDSRGYSYAEATAGGIPLAELDPATLESTVCPGLFFAGEILDVDGRLGGFNFQWAWSSAWVAAAALAARLSAPAR